MSSTEPFRQPFEFDSPVEFVLIGTVGKRRAVVAKSKGAQLDLVAHAQRHPIDEDDDTTASRLKFPFPFPTPLQLQPLSVDSFPTEFPNNRDFDDRASECTLVWRGAGYFRHMQKIKKEFHLRIKDIVDAVVQQSPAQLEWALSPVIDSCYRATLYLKKRRLGFVYAFWFTILVYTIGISVYALTRFLPR